MTFRPSRRVTLRVLRLTTLRSALSVRGVIARVGVAYLDPIDALRDE
ncbi:MAG TPA: hypothetical protein VMG58_04080 [Candidatus Sulfotelmatobacter sp.]|nr:hypothetical protein [Candidatus Sulfotelmatobacter sp.]